MSILTEDYHYYKDCVSHDDSDVEYLEGMIASRKEISYDTLVRAVGREEVASVFSQYDWSRKPRGLTLKGDYHVRYYKGRYAGYPVYYIFHSAIEYIFVPDGFRPPV